MLALMASKFEQGQEGMKVGAGFYRYPDAAYASADFKQQASEECLRALQVALLVPAIQLVTKDVVSREQVDMAWKVGMHLPQGPFEQIERQDTTRLQQLLHESVERGLLLAEHGRAAAQWLASECASQGGAS